MPKRNTFGRLSIFAGNAVQLAGLAAACLALVGARSVRPAVLSFMLAAAAWVSIYFCCHAIAHWAVGRMVGIRFVRYTVGGTGNPQGYPGLLRWIFEHLPFFGVQTEKSSMQLAGPRAKAAMWCAGVTASIIVPTLGALYAWRTDVPGAKILFAFSIFWSIGTLSSNWRSKSGDFAKARLALSNGTYLKNGESGSPTPTGE